MCLQIGLENFFEKEHVQRKAVKVKHISDKFFKKRYNKWPCLFFFFITQHVQQKAPKFKPNYFVLLELGF